MAQRLVGVVYVELEVHWLRYVAPRYRRWHQLLERWRRVRRSLAHILRSAAYRLLPIVLVRLCRRPLSVSLPYDRGRSAADALRMRKDRPRDEWRMVVMVTGRC